MLDVCPFDKWTIHVMNMSAKILNHDVYSPLIEWAKIQHHILICFDLDFSKYSSLVIRLTTCLSQGKSRHFYLIPRRTKV